jgi:EpsI family protein
VSGVLIYYRRKRLAACRLRPSVWGVVLLGCSLAVHLLGTAWYVGFLSGFAFVGALAGLVLALFGWEMLRLTLFPIAFLVFMIPLPEAMVEMVSFRMKLMAARCAAFAIELMGYVAIREGSYIHIPPGESIIVDDVCSGLKYLISLTAFGALYATVCSLRGWRKPFIFLLSIPIAFAANVVRVILMIMAAFTWGVATAEKWYFHDALGFLLFIVAFLMLWVAEYVIDRVLPSANGDTPETDADAPDDAQDDVAQPAEASAASALFAGPLPKIVAAVLAVVAVGSVYLGWPRAVQPTRQVLERIPLTLGPWQGVEMAMEDRVYDILGTQDVLSRQYERTDGARAMLVVVMAQHTHKRTHPPEQCFTGEGYRIDQATVRSEIVRLSDATLPVALRELILARNGGQRVVWYFYKSGDHLSTSYLRHQVGVALRKLADRAAADILIRIDATVPPGGVKTGRELLRDFLGKAMPHIVQELP